MKREHANVCLCFFNLQKKTKTKKQEDNKNGQWQDSELLKQMFGEMLLYSGKRIIDTIIDQYLKL